MRQALAAIADENGFIELPRFVETALYAPAIGYYQGDRRRVGRDPTTDFYTSSSLKDAFAAILVEAAHGLLEQAGMEPTKTDWVEIGAEPDAALLEGVDHGFRSLRAVGPGEPIELSGQLVVFSNELFDAQPFRRLRFREGRWREFGVTFEAPESLAWSERPEPHAELAPWLERLPASTVEDYTIDVPTGSAAIARYIATHTWTGAFIAFDYGKSWSSLAGETPQGSCRSYVQHQMSNDILECPGERDITHHICWDDLEARLTESGFGRISLQSQEAFIVHRTPRFLASVFDPSRHALDPLRSKLKQLMHPALMGQKFQSLSAIRLQ